MAAWGGLASGIARGLAGMGRARQQAMDENQVDALRAQELERRVQQQAFENWVRKQQMERDAERDAYGRSRDAASDARQREQDTLRAQEAGYTDATPDVVGAGMNAATQALGMGRGGMNMGTSPFRTKVGGVEVAAESMGGPRFATVGGKLMRFDPQQGANARAREQAQQAAMRYQERMDMLREQAANRRAMLDATTAARREQQQKPAVITQGERQGTALYQFAEPAAKRVLERYAKGFEASVPDKFAEAGKAMGPDLLFNWMQSDEGQQMYDDLTSVVLATQYALSGKAVTEQEARKLARNLMPAVGDKPGRRAQKMLEVNNRMRILRTMAGRGVNPNAPESLPETMDDARGAGYSPDNPYAR